MCILISISISIKVIISLHNISKVAPVPDLDWHLQERLPGPAGPGQDRRRHRKPPTPTPEIQKTCVSNTGS